MSVQSLLYRQYRIVIDRWPLDLLRPNASFQDELHRRTQKYFGSHVEPDKTIPTQNSPDVKTPGNPESAGKPAMKFDREMCEKELNALGSLLEDRYKKTYPVNDVLLRPKGKPEYYERLMRELEDAPQRSWLSSQISSWKGWIRLK